VAIFSIPLAQQKFLLDPSNVVVTSTALGIGVLGAAAIGATWWIRARMLGVQPQLWRRPETIAISPTSRVLPAK
jgi:cation-transporting P-type ATPase E